jgi:hypothetical protein
MKIRDVIKRMEDEDWKIVRQMCSNGGGIDDMDWDEIIALVRESL